MKKLFAHPLVIIAATIFVGLFVLSLQKTAQKSRTASQNVAAAQQAVDQLTGQLEEEKQALDYASSPLAQEKILRNELLLQKPGEYVIQIPDEAAVEQSTANTQSKTIWDEWKKLLF